MSKRARMRWLALGSLLAALAFPLASWCQDDDDAATSDEEAASDEKPAAKSKSATAEESAQEEEEAGKWDQTYRGFYLQAQGNYAILTTKDDAERKAEDVAGLTSVHTTSDDSWGYGGRIGWRVMQYFGLEAQFELDNNFEFDHDTGHGGSETDMRFLTATLNAKGYWPLGRFQPYALLGGGYAHARLNPPGDADDDNRDGGAMRMGAGIDVYGNEHVALFTEAAYVLPFGAVDDFDNLSIGFGLILRFYGE